MDQLCIACGLVSSHGSMGICLWAIAHVGPFPGCSSCPVTGIPSVNLSPLWSYLALCFMHVLTSCLLQSLSYCAAEGRTKHPQYCVDQNALHLRVPHVVGAQPETD